MSALDLLDTVHRIQLEGAIKFYTENISALNLDVVLVFNLRDATTLLSRISNNQLIVCDGLDLWTGEEVHKFNVSTQEAINWLNKTPIKH